MSRPLFTGAIAALLLIASAPAQVIVPPGFAATSIPFGAEVTGIAVDPSGAYGGDLFVSTNGAVKRVDVATGVVSPFATGLATGAGRPSGLTFDTGAFGTQALYCCQNNSTVVAIATNGAVSPFSSGGTLFSCNDLVMAPPGSAFGAKLFVANGDPGSGTICGVSPAGINSSFASAGNFSNAPLGVDFAPPGSAFGSDLFTSIYLTGQLRRVNSSGVATAFASGLGLSLDFVFSPAPTGPFGDFAYVTDPQTGSLRRVSTGGSVSTFATGFVFGTSGFDGDLVFAPDGQTLFVGSGSQIIVIRSCGSIATYCTGKTNSNGCVPSIGWTGAPDVAGTSDFVVTCVNVLEAKAGLLFYGFAPNAGPFQGGLLCVQQPVRRTSIQVSVGPGGCGSSYSFDFDGLIRSGGDPGLTAFTDTYAQWWMRDPASPSTTGLSNGLRFRICP